MSVASELQRRKRGKHLSGDRLGWQVNEHEAESLMLAAPSVTQHAVDVSRYEYTDAARPGMANIQIPLHDVQVLIAKVTEYRTVDTSAPFWGDQAARFEIQAGGYHFFRANDTQNNVEVYCRTRKSLGFMGLPPILDFELQSSPTTAMVLAFKDFTERVEQYTGEAAIIYTGKWALPSVIPAWMLARKLWIAAYPTPRVTITEFNQWNIANYYYSVPNYAPWQASMVIGWQFTDRGRFTGMYAGGHDLNFWYPNGL